MEEARRKGAERQANLICCQRALPFCKFASRTQSGCRIENVETARDRPVPQLDGDGAGGGGETFDLPFQNDDVAVGEFLALRVAERDPPFRDQRHVRRKLPQEHGFGGAVKVRSEHRDPFVPMRSEEHTSELQSLMRRSYAVFCLKKKKKQ